MSNNFDNSIDWEDDDDFDGIAQPQNTAGVPAPPILTNTPVGDVEAFSETAVDNSIVSVESTGQGEHMTVVQIDSNGNEVVTIIDMALPPLEENEAREITEKIKGTTNLLYLLIKRAHAGKAYKALGYSSFEAYVRDEFNYSRSYAYKLLNQANIIEAIESVVPEGTEVYVGELTARGLKSSLPELLEDIEERTADATPEEAASLIEEAIRDVQNRDRDEDDSYEDYDEGSTYESSGNNEVSSFDFLADDDDEELDEFLSGEDPTIVVKRLEWLWNLINGLQNFADLSDNAEISELPPLIPEARIEEITLLIDKNITWLGDLKVEWLNYLATQPVSNEEEDNSEDDSDADDLEF